MAEGEEESVKVAVRVRPFKREKARNATLIVEMQGNTTMLHNPEAPNEDPRKFAFDHSYWSHDGYEVREDGYIGPVQPNYCDQQKVYDDIGVSVLNNAWEGFNTSLFAYGQTGSGKSWSIVGYGVNRGIVPIFCEEIFKGIQKQKDEGSATQFEVTFSMLEIYNEQVRDLLNPKTNKKGGLKVRQHPKKGFYVEKLLTVAVGSYADIEGRMEEGTTNRTVASTNMNATSSRAHTVVGVTFTQKKKNEAGEETAKTSLINLVDLAGSERADSTGATGDRLKEGAAINQSLSALGNVISALAEKSQGKRIRVPYRDSVLTKLLKNALGGNSKTIMIAAISPADINYDETLSTLRYADRAKQIKTKAVVNEDPTEKLIRDLREQNEKLREMLKQAQGGEVVKIPSGDDDDDDDDESKELSPEEMAELRKQIEEELRASMAATEHEMEEMNKNWDDKVAESQQANKDKEAQKKERESTAHLWNLNPDPQLTGMIVHLLKPGTIKIGNKKADPSPDILLAGLSIQKQHCEIVVDGAKVILKTLPDARVLVNGEPMTEDEELDHGDRLMFGASHLYVFHHPGQAKTSTVNIDDITYEMAQEEIAQNSGIEMDKDDKSRDALLLQEDLVDLIPMIAEANAISQELDKKVSFEAVVVPAKARGFPDGRPEPYVCMKNLETGLEWLWPKNKFINRKFLMQEMYENFEEGEEWKLPDERDPFTEAADTEVMIGCVEVSMQSLGYVLDMREQLSITDYRGREVGYLNIEVVPLNQNGEEITEEDDIFIEDPNEMVGKDLDFVVRILSARGIPKKYTNVFCKYQMYTEELRTEPVMATSNPEFQFEKKFSFKPCSQQFIDYISNKSVIIQLWGQHATGKKPVNKKAKQGMDTKAIMKAERAKKGMKQGRAIHMADLSKNVAEYITMKKRKERLEHKIAQIRALCDKRTRQGHIAVAIKDVRDILGETTRGKQAAFGGKPKGTTDNNQANNQANGTQRVSEERTESSACIIV